METTTIALDREAYELLRTAKRPGESFSKTVKRLARPGTPLSQFAGSWKHLPAKEIRAMRAAVMEGRKAGREKSRELESRRK